MPQGVFFEAIKAIAYFFINNAIGQALLSAAVSVGINQIFGRKPKQSQFDRGIETTLSTVSNAPRTLIYGRAKTGGSLVYADETGTDNTDLWLVIALADHKCNALHQIIVNGREVTWDSGTGVVSDFTADSVDHMVVTFKDGSSTQTAHSGLVSASGPWTNDHRLRGVAHVVIKLVWNGELYSSIPRFEFVVDGRLCYDPRLDSTQSGGSGSHRIDDESTWAFTRNPALQLDDYLRGVFLTDSTASPTVTGQIGGMGIDAADITVADTMAAATVCDGSVSLKAGGSETRYQSGTVVSTADVHRDNIRLFLNAMAGALHDRGGVLSIQAGAAKTSVLTVTDDDIVTTQPFEYEPRRGRDEVVNAVSGRFIDPDQQWNDVEYPTRSDSDDEDEDGGQRWKTDLDLLAVQSGTQAQRIAEIFRRRNRYQGKVTFTGGPRLLELEAGDWFDFESTRYGWTSGSPDLTKTFEVETLTHNPDLTVTIVGQEIASDVYDWTAASDELTPKGQTTPTLPDVGADYGGKIGPVKPAGLSTDTDFSATSWRVVCGVTFASAPKNMLVGVASITAGFQTPNNASADTATAQWAVVLSDTSLAEGAALSGNQRFLWTGASSGLTFTTLASNVVADNNDISDAVIEPPQFIGPDFAGTVYVYLLIKITSGGGESVKLSDDTAMDVTSR